MDWADLSLFLVIPVGFPEYTTLIIAETKEDAYIRSKMMPHIDQCISLFDCEIKIKDATKMFNDQGYLLFIAREGVYH